MNGIELERNRQRQMVAGQVAAEARATFEVASRESNTQIKKKALKATTKALIAQNPPSPVRQSRFPTGLRSDFWR